MCQKGWKQVMPNESDEEKPRLENHAQRGLQSLRQTRELSDHV